MYHHLWYHTLKFEQIKKDRQIFKGENPSNVQNRNQNTQGKGKKREIWGK